MGHKHSRHKRKKHKDPGGVKPDKGQSVESGENEQKRLELVVKCDSQGSLEAIVHSISAMRTTGVDLSIVASGVGDINKNDLFLAGTASGLILGYEIKANKVPEVEIQKNGIEIRLYTVIYRLMDDVKRICESLISEGEGERILGFAKVIKLFKSCRKGVILGCEVFEGRIARGDRFRIIGAMGQIYTGKVGSLHIDNNAVDSVSKGRKAGLKIEDFQKVALGDIVECVKYSSNDSPIWKPVPGIISIN